MGCLGAGVASPAGAAVGARAPSRQVAPPAVRYVPPVDAPVVDPFRPPATPYGPGNRGWEYATAPGTAIRAAGAGDVVFAGRVGPASAVTVRHADGLRTSYSRLAEVAVAEGDVVAAGQVVGRSAERFHFGVRRGETYLDPAELFAASTPPPPRPRPRLVPLRP